MTEQFTINDKLKEVERELRMRAHVYPRLVSQKKMTDIQAAEQIAIFQAIADDYRKLAESERLLSRRKWPQRTIRSRGFERRTG